MSVKFLGFLFRLLQFSLEIFYFFTKKNKYLTNLFICEFTNGFSHSVKNL